jgi:arsenate reductase
MKTFIFACIHNAGRSQMSAAFFSELADSRLARAVSAATQPADKVHPMVVEVMREAGIELAKARPQKLTEELTQGADVLVTMGCGDQCPYVPGLRRLDWTLTDPQGLPIEEVRLIRDEIRLRVCHLIEAEGLQK